MQKVCTLTMAGTVTPFMSGKALRDIINVAIMLSRHFDVLSVAIQRIRDKKHHGQTHPDRYLLMHLAN
jgi:hypothetical protein